MLIRPKAGFVVKTYKMVMEGEAEGGGEERRRMEEVEEKTKVFINIVTSDSLAPPSAAAAASSKQGGGVGRMYTIPHVVGRPREEKDKGGASVPTVDLCVHPVCLALSSSSSSLGRGGAGREGGREGGGGFKDLLVQLALESAMNLWQAEEDKAGGRVGGKTRKRRRRVDVDWEYIILNGCSYKTGKEPATLMADQGALASFPPSLPPMVLPPPKNKTAEHQQQQQQLLLLKKKRHEPPST